MMAWSICSIFLLVIALVHLSQCAVGPRPQGKQSIPTFLLRKEFVPKNRRILEHSQAGKCLTVADDYRLFLDKCNWERTELLDAGVFSIIKSNPGGHLLRWSTGENEDSIVGCLTERNYENEEGVAVGRPEIALDNCDPKSPKQNWKFEDLEDAKYLVRRYPEGKCLTVKSHDQGASLDVATCDSENSEHIWRICENQIGVHKCDI